MNTARARGVSRRQFIGLLGMGSLGTVTLAACGGSSAPAEPAAPAAPAAGSGGDVTLTIASKGSTPFFDTEKLEAKARSKITLTFKNNAEAGSGKQYNWVLVKPGMMLKVVSQGQSEGTAESSYIKPNDENVLAHTKLLNASESDTITFDAPPPGDYPFISTFPGLYNTMKGVLTVK